MLKHLTLSSGCMQKQQWMLHLYWIEVIRREFALFYPLSLSLPFPNRSVLRVWSGVQAALRRVRTRAEGSRGRSGFFFFWTHRPLSHLRRFFKLREERNILHSILLIIIKKKTNAQAYSAKENTWGRNEKAHDQFSAERPFRIKKRRESAFWGNRRCNLSSRRHPLPVPFPATSWRTFPSPNH